MLRRALTHRSHGAEHNERLEFLGDAVLNLVVSELLYAAHPTAREGALSRLRAQWVCEASLHGLAQQLGLAAHLRLSEGEARSGGAQRPSILADAFEAVLGALYLDAGLPAVQALVGRCMAPKLAEAGSTPDDWAKDPKTALQEWLQARRHSLPQYRIAATQGQDHAQVFEVECWLSELGRGARGQGRSRRAAEQDAARRLLAELVPPAPSPP